MKRIFLSALVMIAAVVFQPNEAAAYGWLATVDCEFGNGLAPAPAPNPNIYCEMTWENTGPNRVQHGKFAGQLTANGVFADEVYGTIFRFDVTPQPLFMYVGCSNITAPMNLTVQGYMYMKDPPKDGGGYSLWNFDSTYGSGTVPSNGGAGCTLGGG
jgi:hypothetical protein